MDLNPAWKMFMQRKKYGQRQTQEEDHVKRKKWGEASTHQRRPEAVEAGRDLRCSLHMPTAIGGTALLMF